MSAYSGNLVTYGVEHEVSDWRCHVCFGEGAVYLFPTDSIKQVVDNRDFSIGEAGQPGVEGITGVGLLVPCAEIPDLCRVPIPQWMQAKTPVTRQSCDWNGGTSGTGNLFIQTAECNPLGLW